VPVLKSIGRLTGAGPAVKDGRMGIYDINVHTLSGEPVSMGSYSGKSLLIVNVASQCGMTPQYAGLQLLHERYAERGFAVLGFPCNQFGNQEPGTPKEISEFCETTYGVTFPLFEKIEVNGPGQHPLFADLTKSSDASGRAGAVMWNFEKFLVSPKGEVTARFRPNVPPEDPDLVAAVESTLPG
jgi:glutathione peroxidase